MENKFKTKEAQITAQKYADIIHLSRPASKHIKMDLVQRAKIFSSFDALRGYKEAVELEGWKMQRVKKQYLSEDAAAVLDSKLAQVRKGMRVELTYFKVDDLCQNPPIGYYVTLSGIVEQLDTIFHTIKIEKTVIYFDDLLDIHGEEIAEVMFD